MSTFTETNVIQFLAALGDSNATHSSQNRLSEKKTAIFLETGFNPSLPEGTIMLVSKIRTADIGTGEINFGPSVQRILLDESTINLDITIPCLFVESYITKTNLVDEYEYPPVYVLKEMELNMAEVYIEYYEYTFPSK